MMAAEDKAATLGAFAKDKLYGNRLTDAFAEGEQFGLLAGKLGETIDTDIGPAILVNLYVVKLDATGQPGGAPFSVNTLASAIREKIEDLQGDELPCVVCWQHVPSKKWNREATVLQFVRPAMPEAIAEEARAFGFADGDAARAVDAFRSPQDRMGI